MAAGYKFIQNGESKDINSLIPKFPEGTNVTLDFKGNGKKVDGISFLSADDINKTDPWAIRQSLNDYISNWYKTTKEYTTFDPASKPTFNNLVFEIPGHWGTSETSGACTNTGDGHTLMARFRRDGSALRLSVYDHSAGDIRLYNESWYPSTHGISVIPKRVIVVACAAGGQGCSGDTDRHGAGGGGGGAAIYVIDVPLGTDEANYVTFYIPPGLPYNKDLKANGKDGGDLIISATNGNHIAVVQGGEGATWWVDGWKKRAVGGYGQDSYQGREEGTSGWYIAECHGGNGSDGTQPDAPTNTLLYGGDTGKTKAIVSNLTNAPDVYCWTFDAQTGGAGFPTWAGGGGASMLGPGGNGAFEYKDKSGSEDPNNNNTGNVPSTGWCHGRPPVSGYGGGGGGGYKVNWGGGSAPGYIAIYF